MDYKNYFKGKKITLMGLGLLGRGIGDAKFLAECGADLIVTDMKSEEELKDSLADLKDFPNIKFVLGEHRLEDFRGRDFILKSAGVPLDSPYIKEAREHGIPVDMSTALFAALTPATVVGVTGTRGKSTVTHLLYEILKEWTASRFNLGFGEVFLGGNIRGVATLPFLKEAKEGDIAVLELDSWQLQGFGERKISPHVAVFTTFLNDHLNYYKKVAKDEAEAINLYLSDKANIFKYQTDKDFLILGEQCAKPIQDIYHDIKSTVFAAHAYDIGGWQMRIPGEHNRYNAACAMRAAQALGVPDEVIKRVVENFGGVPGRLQLIREVRGVKIYNDTTATTPDATIAAFRALSAPPLNSQSSILNPKIVLIMGGADKGLDMSRLVSHIPEYCKSVIMLPGTGTDNLKSQISNIKSEIQYAKDLKDAVQMAMEKAKAGDTVLFSPAFASFGMFKNEYDRGDKFNDIIGLYE